MRIDHQAYQRATRVAGFGFLAQLLTGLTLLIFSLLGGETIPQDTPLLYGSIYVLLGLLVWLGLIVIFNQHKLERLESLEHDELVAARGEGASMFEGGEEPRVAARRLRLMHKWLMPGLSVILAAGLVILAWLMIAHGRAIGDGDAPLRLTAHTGWAVAICLGFAAFSFIFSRFVAGMAKQPVWHNLRGGAAWMVGTALICLAIAVGISFRFFNNEVVISVVAGAIPYVMLLLAGEIVLNFILNLYRPRVPGDVPRPAFDSKVLSLFAAPDNLVRTINDAVNYQFGFDITSSWGYQLFVRSFAWLLIVGVGVLILLNMIVVIEPQEQAVKLSRGKIVEDKVHDSGVMFKLPWPFQTAERYNVARVRQLPLTGRQVRDTGVNLWTDDLGRKFDRQLEPFIVGSTSSISLPEPAAAAPEPGRVDDLEVPEEVDEESARVSRTWSLVDAELVLEYRIKEGEGLLDYLRFSSDMIPRRQQLTMREQLLRGIALREITQVLSRLSIQQVLGGDRYRLADAMHNSIQRAFDEAASGVELVAVNIPLLRPAADASGTFENLSISHQNRQKLVAEAQQDVATAATFLLGDPEHMAPVIANLDEWERLRDTLGSDALETIEQRVRIEQMMRTFGGHAAQVIAEAERDRWVDQMEAMARAIRVQGQEGPYRTAPRLYRQREIMQIYARMLPPIRKYLIGIDMSRVSFDMELKEINPMFATSDAIVDTDEE